MDDHVTLKIAKQCLTVVGFWPRRFTRVSHEVLYRLYCSFTIAVFAMFVFSQFIELYKVLDATLAEFSGLMAINFLYTVGLIKIFVLRQPTAQSLIRKIRVTEMGILASGDAATRAVFGEYVRKAYNSNSLMVALGILCYFQFMLTPYFEELHSPAPKREEVANVTVYLPRPLPLVSWFPFDRYKYYGLSYFWHCFAAVFNTTYIVGCNNTFFSVMIFASGQMKILQNYIVDLKRPRFCRRKAFDDVVADNLNGIVQYHNAIIRFVEETDQMMRWFLLMDFAACALQIAMIGFEIAVSEPSFQMLKNTIYLSSMVTQLFLFYWHGNEIILESINTADAVWQSPWYDCDQSAKKTLLQVMERAQKPLGLSVGMLYSMSTETMVNILRSSYSYAALMQQLYSTN